MIIRWRRGRRKSWRRVMNYEEMYVLSRPNAIVVMKIYVLNNDGDDFGKGPRLYPLLDP